MYEEKNWKKSLNKTKIILFNIFFFLFVCLRCINWVIRFPNTVTYWLVWLYTTSERQILFFSFDYRNYLQCVSMMLRGAWTLNEPFKLPKVFRYLMGWMDTVRAKISLICEIIKGSRSGFHFSNLQKSLFVAKDQTLYITLNYYSHKNSVLHRNVYLSDLFPSNKYLLELSRNPLIKRSCLWNFRFCSWWGLL